MAASPSPSPSPTSLIAGSPGAMIAAAPPVDTVVDVSWAIAAVLIVLIITNAFRYSRERTHLERSAALEEKKRSEIAKSLALQQPVTVVAQMAPLSQPVPSTSAQSMPAQPPADPTASTTPSSQEPTTVAQTAPTP